MNSEKLMHRILLWLASRQLCSGVRLAIPILTSQSGGHQPLKILYSIKYFVIILLYTFSCILNAQQINVKYYPHWSTAGSGNPFTAKGKKINVLSYGADSSGKNYSDTAIKKALQNAKAGDTVFFSKGHYKFKQSILLKDSIVFAGTGEESMLNFNLSSSADAIQCRGSISKARYNLTKSAIAGDSFFAVTNPLFIPGTLLQLFQNDSDLITSSWAKNTVSEIITVVKNTGDSIYFFPPLKLNYPLSRKPWMVIINPAKCIQIRCLKLVRLDSTLDQNSNINLNYCNHVLISGIYSQNCNYAHISIDNSTHCTVTGSFFTRSFGYGGGGKGYGIAMQTGSCENLITNNVFGHLRHSVLMQSGANGNVISYNYSYDPFWTEASVPANSSGDLVLHGNYPFANLFEGNICQNIVIDDSHGKNGPENVFFRNRAELYGIFMNTNPASDKQGFVNNEVPNTGFLMGLYYINGTAHWELGNKIRGAFLPAGTKPISDSSFYLKSAPGFWFSSFKWPFCGSLNSSGTDPNPAQKRALRNYSTTCEDLTFLRTKKLIKNETNGFEIIGNPATGFVHIKTNSETPHSFEYQLFKSTGERVYFPEFGFNSATNTCSANIQNLNSGIYFLKINGETKKLVILN